MFLFRRWFKKKIKNQSVIQQRTSYGIVAGLVGLISNLALFVIKVIVGLISGSISIITDAINNLSDTFSSALTVIGFKMAGKKPDHDHPYGHERSESISGLLISIVITFVGLQFVKSSFDKIVDPNVVHMSWQIYLVLLISIVLKLAQVYFYKQIAGDIDSETLLATAKDSLNDVYTTVAVLISAVIQAQTGWALDGWVGLGVAIYILISAVGLIRTFISELLGHQPSEQLVEKMTERLASYGDILGFHDLLIHQYGPNTIFASVHIEIDSRWELDQAHQVTDQIEHDFWHQLRIHLVCHLDPIDIDNQKYAKIYEAVQAVVKHYNLGLTTHDFHVEELVNEDELIQFDVVVPEEIKTSDDELLVSINHDLRKILGDVTAEVTFDHNYIGDDHSLI
ncbi:cation diffusion facilitator family transporter [Lapidilactobacillus mulanensis]|uniref:Cation diffusion facilitator family transporter n=1 Tax=Lapidilactobacillus mulanensis TaxID=2485999 RepID=A0ABW4DLS2_9LACO|nr:cation diffusion facilitator family transporter [Lapidilactobacillus mulanensis]